MCVALSICPFISLHFTELKELSVWSSFPYPWHIVHGKMKKLWDNVVEFCLCFLVIEQGVLGLVVRSPRFR